MTMPARRAVGTCLLTLLVVACGPAPATPAPSEGPRPTAAPTEAAASPSPRPVDIAGQMQALLGPDFSGAALVARDGDILFGEGVGMADAEQGIPNVATSRFRLGSVSKQFTAMAVLLLDQAGMLSTDQHACAYLDVCPPGWETITIEHLIAHTSGIAEFTEQPGFDQTRATTPAETIAAVADIPLAFEPGRTFSYSNSGYVLLGMIIERASGMTYEAFLEDRIFGPLGMADSGYDSGDDGVAVGYTTGVEPAAMIDMSIPYAAGALYSTTLDLLRWDEALYTDALLPRFARDRFFAPLIDSSDRVGMGYGFGLEVGTENGHALVAHDGGIDGFRSYLARYPDDHIVVALLTNREAGPDLASLAPIAAWIAREAPEAAAGGMTLPIEATPTGSRVDLPVAAAGRSVSVIYRARLVAVGPTCGLASDPAAGPDAASILAALQARPGWSIERLTPVTLGVASGWWFDLRRPDALTCPDGGINIPLFISDLDEVEDVAAVHIDPGYASRVFLLDDGRGGSIVIDINAHRAFQQASLVERAMPIILGLRFAS